MSRYFVQFAHPGPEHRPQGDRMPWNVGKHRRKFLRSPGRYVGDSGPVESADLVFWAEWEPPSTVERRWPPSDDLPRFLHQPYWVLPRGGHWQNTDPWVFGERMLYSNCLQLRMGEPSGLQRLGHGSVICFGSKTNHAFRLDTVFVVATAEPWGPGDARALGLDPAFITCTAEALTSGGCTPPGPLTLYRGATVDGPIDGMYSFVPARRADDGDSRFARPAIAIEQLIDPEYGRAARGTARPLSAEQIRHAWNEVRLQVLDADLLLGVWLQVPDFAGDEDVPISDHRSC